MPRLTAKIREEAKHRSIVVLYRFQLKLADSQQEGKEALKIGDNDEISDNKGVDIELLEVEDEISVYRVQRKKIR